MTTKPVPSKHARIRQTLVDAISSGKYEAGQRLPSESELVQRFGELRRQLDNDLFADLYLQNRLAFPVADRVGAGDVFAATLLHGVVSDWTAVQAASAANRIGAFVAASRGAIPDPGGR